MSIFAISGMSNLMNELLDIPVDSDDEDNVVFGVEIESRAGENAIHPFVRDLMNHTFEVGKEVEGIFRISGSKQKVRDFVELVELNGGREYEADLQMVSAHDSSSLLKNYIMRLKKPVFRTDVFSDKFLTEVNEKKAEISPAGIKELKGRVHKLGKGYMHLLYEIVRFIDKFSPYVSKTKMTSDNMSRVWGPVLVVPTSSKVFNPEVVVELSIHIFHILLTKTKELFPSQIQRDED